MKYTFIIAAMLLVTLASCNSKKALKYSQTIVKLERSLMSDIELTETKVEQYANEQNYDSIVAVSDRMEKIIDRKLQEVTTMQAPKVKEAENFKQASIRYFSYLKSIYTSYKKFGLAQSDEDRQRELQNLQNLVGGKTVAVTEMQTAQKKFADANGFKVEGLSDK